MNRGMTFSRCCRGPYWLNGRTIIAGRLYVAQYEYTSRSAPAFAPAYGLMGISGASSSIFGARAVPYTSDVEM